MEVPQITVLYLSSDTDLMLSSQFPMHNTSHKLAVDSAIIYAYLAAKPLVVFPLSCISSPSHSSQKMPSILRKIRTLLPHRPRSHRRNRAPDFASRDESYLAVLQDQLREKNTGITVAASRSSRASPSAWWRRIALTLTPGLI